MRQETTGFGDAVASAGPYANNLHLVPDRQPHQHLISQFLQAGCSSWRPTNGEMPHCCRRTCGSCRIFRQPRPTPRTTGRGWSQHCLFSRVSRIPKPTCNTWFLGSSRVGTPNGISIDWSHVLDQLLMVISCRRERHRPFHWTFS